MTETTKPLQMTALFVDPADWQALKRLGRERSVSAGLLARQAMGEFLKREAAKQSRAAREN